MDETLLTNLESPRCENLKILLIAGVRESYNSEACAGIPAQWQRFVPYLDHIPGQVGRTTYGVVCNGDDAGNTEYICGVEVADFSRVSSELNRHRIPEQRYAVFTQRDHIATIRQTWFTIWNTALLESGYQASGGPEFEGDRHADRYRRLRDWVPIKM